MRFLGYKVLLVLIVEPMCVERPTVTGHKGPVTDDTITDQVLVKLANDSDLGGIKFDVTVQNGAVTLKGKVRSDKFKTKAEKVAKKVKGVTSVINQLVISPD